VLRPDGGAGAGWDADAGLGMGCGQEREATSGRPDASPSVNVRANLMLHMIKTFYKPFDI